jgi:methyl-accepting chemotaxis protein
MKLQKKLTIWSAISLIFISAVGIVSWFGVRQLLTTIESVVHTYQMIQHSLQLENSIYKLEADEEHYLFLSEEVYFLKEYNINKKLIADEIDLLLKKVRTPSQRDLIVSINQKIDNWEKNIADVEMRTAKKSAAKKMMTDSGSDKDNDKDNDKSENPHLNPLPGGDNPSLNPLPGGEQKGWVIEHRDFEAHKNRVIGKETLLSEAASDIDRFIENEKMLMNLRKEKVFSNIYRISIVIVSSIILFVILYAVISYFLSRSVVKPLLATTMMMKDISEGKADLTKRLHSKSNDEFRELIYWFNIFISKLHEIMKHIKNENIRMKNSSSKLFATATGLANAAVETSSSADELFSVAEDVTQTLDFTKEKTSEYIADSREILLFIQSDFMNNVSYEKDRIVTIKENIEDTSTNILEMNKQILNLKSIIDSINDLANQSKILSINASVQATKAGDYGKGFDVVAKEIKELAHKSEDSVRAFFKSIKEILNISNDAGLSVEKNSDFIYNSISSSESLKNLILKHTNNISELVQGMNEMSSIFSKQHEDTSVLLNTAKQIKLSTEANAQGAKKIQNAADNLEEFSIRLNSLIDDFKV